MHNNLKKIILAAIFCTALQVSFANAQQAPDVPFLPPPVEEGGALPKELGGSLPKDLGGKLPEPKPAEEKKEEPKKEETKPAEPAKPAEEKKEEPKKEEAKPAEKHEEEKKGGLKKVPDNKRPPKKPQAQEGMPKNMQHDPLNLQFDMNPNAPDEVAKRKQERQMKELQQMMEKQLNMIKESNPDIQKAMEDAKKQGQPPAEEKPAETPPPPPPKQELPPPPQPVKVEPPPPVSRGKDNPIIFNANSVLRISPPPDQAKPELDDLELNFRVSVERGREVFPPDIIIKDNFQDDDHGSLFVYPVKQQAVLNLSKLYVTRDILFINEFGEIIEIARKVPPRNSTPIISKEKVMYVLQLNPGVVRKYAIRVGDKALLISQEDIFRN